MQNPHERVTRALDLLTQGLCPYVERELKARYKDRWIAAARASFRDERSQSLPKGEVIRWDAHALLTVMWDQWNGVFRHQLGHFERSLISELRDFRNRWAHQATFDFDDTFRILDSVQRLLTAISAREADEVTREKRELLRDEFAEEVNSETRRIAFAKDKLIAITVFITCCVAIVMQLFNSLGWERGWVLALFTSVLFLFLIYKRLVADLPILGPHECRRCNRIIYSDVCPYCTPSPAPPVPPSSSISEQSRTAVAEHVEV